MVQGLNLASYFERIGFSGSFAPSAATLETLLLLHQAAIPFENLDALLGLATPLDLRSVARKLIGEGRGGEGLEHNILFGAVLEDLGYPVRRLLARPFAADRAGSDHLVLQVELSGTPVLVDAGFGPEGPTAPLKLRPGLEVETPHDAFRIEAVEGGLRLERKVGFSWRPLFHIDDGEPRLPDALPEPADPALIDLLVSRADAEGRTILFNSTLHRRPAGGEREVRQLESVAALKEALREIFGLSLPETEALDQRLGALPGLVQAAS